MSEPNTHAAGEGVSDEEMIETVAGQTDSASENADVAGKDWDGDPASAPAPRPKASGTTTDRKYPAAARLTCSNGVSSRDTTAGGVSPLPPRWARSRAVSGPGGVSWPASCAQLMKAANRWAKAAGSKPVSGAVSLTGGTVRRPAQVQ